MTESQSIFGGKVFRGLLVIRLLVTKFKCRLWFISINLCKCKDREGVDEAGDFESVPPRDWSRIFSRSQGKSNVHDLFGQSALCPSLCSYSFLVTSSVCKNKENLLEDTLTKESFSHDLSLQQYYQQHLYQLSKEVLSPPASDSRSSMEIFFKSRGLPWFSIILKESKSGWANCLESNCQMRVIDDHHHHRLQESGHDRRRLNEKAVLTINARHASL